MKDKQRQRKKQRQRRCEATSSSTKESLVEKLQANRQLFNQQASQMEALTAGLQSLTEEMRRLQTNQVNDKEEVRSMINNMKPSQEISFSSAMSSSTQGIWALIHLWKDFRVIFLPSTHHLSSESTSISIWSISTTKVTRHDFLVREISTVQFPKAEPIIWPVSSTQDARRWFLFQSIPSTKNSRSRIVGSQELRR